MNYINNNEEIERDLYLRTLLTGERLGPLTGKASIDKPWLINYSNEQIGCSIPSRRMYEDLLDYTQNLNSQIAIEYFGNKITYEELRKNIEITASSFVKLGVTKDDVVSVCAPYLPETIYTIYALNKIGAVINMIDPRINGELITEYINNANSKYIVTIGNADEKIKNLLPKTIVKKVVSIPATNSMKNVVLKTLGGLKKSPFIKWNDFIDNKAECVQTAEHKKDELAIIEYTSGTSGKPKGVMLSNESFNALAYFQNQSLINNVGDKFLLIMPPFIAYGLVIGMHDMLCQGQHLLMIPNFTLDKAPKMLGELVDKYHPNSIMGVPNFLSILMNYDKDLSFLKNIIIGGDHLDKEIEKKANEFFKEHNSSATVLKGWGMTEVASCGTFTKNDVKNNLGSVGIPLSKNNIKILPMKANEEDEYDIDSEEVYYGEKGILFISSPSMTLGYFKNEEATNRIIYTDKNGKKWVNSGDVFKMDSDGSLYFCGREKRIVVRPDGHNIPSEKIESIASAMDEVETAVVVGVPSKKYDHGSMATLCICLKDKELSCVEKNELLKVIEKNSNAELQPRDRAKYYLIVDKIPYTPNGKVDYISLTAYAEELVGRIEAEEDSRETFYIFENELAKEKKKTKKRKK